jgi:hypothetical protein
MTTMRRLGRRLGEFSAGDSVGRRWWVRTDDDDAAADSGRFHGGPWRGDVQEIVIVKCTDGH